MFLFIIDISVHVVNKINKQDIYIYIYEKPLNVFGPKKKREGLPNLQKKHVHIYVTYLKEIEINLLVLLFRFIHIKLIHCYFKCLLTLHGINTSP